jgi:leucyl aminopeptidase (aminopeptidase T)
LPDHDTIKAWLFLPREQLMDFDDEISDISTEIGSDELLADDSLRLPESANILVRLHAVRAWLTRRYEETTLEVGEAALALQEQSMLTQPETRLRRRERHSQEERLAHVQQELNETRQRLDAYEEAQALLEDCIDHTSGERVLVEYYLTLEDLLQSISPEDLTSQAPRLRALADVQHRIEHVGVTEEAD